MQTAEAALNNKMHKSFRCLKFNHTDLKRRFPSGPYNASRIFLKRY